jgi:sulfonate transport system substrate-binding protein
VLAVSDEIIAAQQHTAQLFFDNRLLPRQVQIAPAVWRRP